MNCAVFYCEKMRGSGRRERQRTGEEPLPQRVREMVLCSLFLQHGFDSTEKDMDVPVGAGLQHMDKLYPFRTL